MKDRKIKPPKKATSATPLKTGVEGKHAKIRPGSSSPSPSIVRGPSAADESPSRATPPPANKERPNMTKNHSETATQGAMKGLEDMSGFGKANIEAAMAASQTLVKGIEQMNRAWSEFTMRLVEAHMNSVQALFGCKNLKDVVELQADFAKKQLEAAMVESSKLSELTLKVANEAIQPLSVRVSEAMNTAVKAA